MSTQTSLRPFGSLGPAQRLSFRPPNAITLCAVAVVLATVTILSAPPAVAQVPRGVFSMGQTGGRPSDNVLENPDVTGVTIRWNWADIEPTQGEFFWEGLDDVITLVRDANKKVLLRISTQAGKPDWVTQAVADAGGSFFTFDDNGTTTTIPVFWDPTFLEKKTKMIAALGAHYANDPTIAIVSASFANATSEDWNVPHSPGDLVQEWLDLGYTTQKLVDAGKQIIDATMTAFPTQYVSLAINGSGPDLDEDLCPTLKNTCAAATAIDDAHVTWPGRLVVQIDSLSGCNPPTPGPDDRAWNLLWNSQPNVAAQMVDNVYDETSYRANCGSPGLDTAILMGCVTQGSLYGVEYVEIYETDVRHLPVAITYTHKLLRLARWIPPTPIPPAHSP
jgi:hypothetical protein